jgi:1-deoxy-D-xylulose-5-phosphate synthase
MLIMAPANENECRQMLYTGYLHKGPAAVRYPRGKGPGLQPQAEMSALPVGQSARVRSGEKIAILAWGSMVQPCTRVAEKLGAGLINMRFIKPLDTVAILQAAAEHDALVTVEENAVAGGAGSAVNELLTLHGVHINVLNLGLADDFIEHGTREECLALAGLDDVSLLSRIEAFRTERMPTVMVQQHRSVNT